MWSIAVALLLASFLSVDGSVITDDYEEIQTNGERKLIASQYDFTTFNYVKFQVKACKLASVRIGNIAEDGVLAGILLPDYFLFLGKEKTANVNRVQVHPIVGSGIHQVIKDTVKRKLLKCNEFVQFYLRWRGENKTFEFGTVQGVLASANDPFQADRPLSADVGVRSVNGSGVFRIFNPQIDSKYCRNKNGNQYCKVPGMDCRFFTQKDVSTTPGGSTNLLRCGPGTRFNLNLCVCDHAGNAQCNL